MKKRTAVLLGSLVLLVALAAAGTWAYFAGEAHVTNQITTGTIAITLNDQVETELTGVMPGQTVDQVVSVTNDNKETAGDAWVRVKVDTTVFDDNGKALDNTVNGEPVVTFKANETDWLYSDGYYYYTTPMAPAATTETLFETVTVSSKLDNTYQNCRVNITVLAQAVQVKNNGDTITKLDDDNLDQVKGWPADTTAADTTASDSNDTNDSNDDTTDSGESEEEAEWKND
jgi:alternate signal-mediated exported protein